MVKYETYYGGTEYAIIDSVDLDGDLYGTWMPNKKDAKEVTDKPFRLTGFRNRKCCTIVKPLTLKEMMNE